VLIPLPPCTLTMVANRVERIADACMNDVEAQCATRRGLDRAWCRRAARFRGPARWRTLPRPFAGILPNGSMWIRRSGTKLD